MVIRVTHPGAFDHLEIREFFLRALQANKIPNPEGTILELQHRIIEPFLGVFAGAEDGKVKGVCIAQLPTSNFALGPQVLLAYNEGPPRLVNEVMAAVKNWIEQAGFTYLFGCNRSGRPDAAWLRVFKQAGTASPVGMIYQFQWGE